MPPEEWLPVSVRINDIIEVYDPVRKDWYNARWTIYQPDPKTKYAKIDISTSGDHTVIPAVTARKIIVSTIVFTVGGEVNVTLKAGGGAISGPMDFGGSNEPRGIVINMGDHGIEIGEGVAFKINLSASKQVSGFVVYSLK